jgi:D-glycero-D-manno-heptose 1,7-bisphosphate phosphatase
MSQAIIVCGYPASGKSSLTKELVKQGFVPLNRDTEGGSVIDLLPKMESFLQNGKKVVLDNLFASVESRKPFVELAHKLQVPISCQVMGTSFEDASFNAVQRMIELTGKFPSQEDIKKSKHPNIFPIVVLFKYKKEHQKPTVQEGFTQVETIKFQRREPAFTNKAVILDYDGTLRECLGGNGKYPVLPEQIEIKPRRTEILQRYQKDGYILLGCSNQSGIAKGDLTYQQCQKLFDQTNSLLGLDIPVSFCPHQSAPPVCYCRKPQVGHGVEMIHKYQLDRKQCLFVGDMKSDETFSKRCGFQYVDQAEFFK